MRLPWLRGPARQRLKVFRDAVRAHEQTRHEGKLLGDVVARAKADHRHVLVDRMGVLLRALEQTVPVGDAQSLCTAVENALASADASRIWLALGVLTGRLPLDEDVTSALRRLRLDGAGAALGTPVAAMTSRLPGNRLRPSAVEVRTDVVMVDVDFTAKHDAQTGIQRVVRRLIPRWHRDHELELVVWTDHGGAIRALHDDEQERVLRWTRPLQRPAASTDPVVVLVPWRSTLVLPEVPALEQCARLTSLAMHSGNRVAAVGHDCIPAFSAELMPDAGEPNRFVRYLSIIKHADVLAGVSASAAGEFRGFVSALASQGLQGPRVVACPLGSDDISTGPDDTPITALPEVLVVGSHEPRKNHLAVLHAAEVLWRDGMVFRLRFLGAAGGTWTTEFDRRVKALASDGRPVSTERGLDDEHLWNAYKQATFSVFPSLHEGFGLPVIESLSFGTPVIATAYGSVAEHADQGGMVLVDPRDDDALTEAMRSLLRDPDLMRQLRAAAGIRRVRSWDDYAAELWQRLVVER